MCAVMDVHQGWEAHGSFRCRELRLELTAREEKMRLREVQRRENKNVGTE